MTRLQCRFISPVAVSRSRRCLAASVIIALAAAAYGFPSPPPQVLAGDPPAPPPPDPPTLLLPDEATDRANPAQREHPAVRRKIEEMIQRRELTGETGDPILDGVLENLHSQGSVLDGSVLDPRAPLPLPSPSRGESPRGADDLVGQSSVGESRYVLAEQLLKTARLLARAEAADGQRRSSRRAALIAQLRAEALRCLSEPPPPAAPLDEPVPSSFPRASTPQALRPEPSGAVIEAAGQ